MPRQRSRSPLSPILATESATVRLFFILSVLLCSVNNAGLKTETWLLYCLRLRSRSPHNAKHSTSYNIIMFLKFNMHVCVYMYNIYYRHVQCVLAEDVITISRGGCRIDGRGVLRVFKTTPRALARAKFYVPHPLLALFPHACACTTSCR